MSKRKPARTIKARSASKIRSKAAGSGQPKGRARSVTIKSHLTYMNLTDASCSPVPVQE
jgi:hypothetical protein